jgi:hypothetical protein
MLLGRAKTRACRSSAVRRRSGSVCSTPKSARAQGRHSACARNLWRLRARVSRALTCRGARRFRFRASRVCSPFLRLRARTGMTCQHSHHRDEAQSGRSRGVHRYIGSVQVISFGEHFRDAAFDAADGRISERTKREPTWIIKKLVRVCRAKIKSCRRFSETIW